jgi:hypothetical protein
MVAFVTPEELASFMQSDLDRATAELAVDMATAYVQNIVGQRITQGTSNVTLYVTDPGATTVRLPQWPATDVTEVTIGGGAAVTDFTVLPTGLYRANGFTTGQTYSNAPVPVTVAYTHGYDPIPDDIKAATLYVAAQMYGNPSGATSVAIDDYRESRSDNASRDLLPAAMVEQLKASYGGGAWTT